MVCTVGVGCVLSMNCKEEEKASIKNENGMEGNHVHIDIQDNIEETDHERVTNKSVEKKFLEVDAGPESVPLIASATPSVTGNDSSITENYTSTSTIPCENPYKLPNPLVVKIDSEDQTSPDILTNKIEDEKINDKSNQCPKGDANNDCQFSCIKDDQISLNALLDPTPERLENDSFLVLPIVDPDSRDAEISKSLNESENKSMITSELVSGPNIDNANDPTSSLEDNELAYVKNFLDAPNDPDNYIKINEIQNPDPPTINYNTTKVTDIQTIGDLKEHALPETMEQEKTMSTDLHHYNSAKDDAAIQQAETPEKHSVVLEFKSSMERPTNENVIPVIPREQLEEGKTPKFDPCLELKDISLQFEKNEDQENITNVAPEKKLALLGSIEDCLNDEEEKGNKTFEEQNIKSDFSIDEPTIVNVLNDAEKSSAKVQLSEEKTHVLDPYSYLKDPALPSEKNKEQENETNADRAKKQALLGSIEDCVNDVKEKGNKNL